jgi:MoxR-like ATPase
MGNWYRGDGTQSGPPQSTSELARRARHPHPGDYLADDGLVNAVNVALLLNQPLLLTGEPGTGKSQLAYSVAWELGLGEPLRFNTKSTSTARDLLYSYDALGRFHAAQTGGATDTARFITFNALGLAILYTNEPADLAAVLGNGRAHETRRRSVVLVDEVDKAPRDFPNDLLIELEESRFRIPELGNVEICANRQLLPILIITSNSEKDLPDAFLRRCAYYHLPFPDRQRLTSIVERRLGQYAGGSSDFLSSALDLFELLRRKGAGLRKPPSTAEFLAWVAALRNREPDNPNPLSDARAAALQTLSLLVKTAEDQGRSADVVARWAEGRSATAPDRERSASTEAA